ncbi:MAG: hypothetical protein RL227_2009 [Pseudomonadota bacterium]|jgi:hypothetical protein
MKRSRLALFACLLALGGCETSPHVPREPAIPKAELQFVDLPGFDSSLTSSLAAQLPQVGVGFYDRVTPNAIPERLQVWLAAVENGGGTIKVTPPPKAAVTTRSPLLLLSALSSLWTASKMAGELRARQQFQAAQSYDAELVLKLDDKGGTVLDKVIFSQRQR